MAKSSDGKDTTKPIVVTAIVGDSFEGMQALRQGNGKSFADMHRLQPSQGDAGKLSNGQAGTTNPQATAPTKPSDSPKK